MVKRLGNIDCGYGFGRYYAPKGQRVSLTFDECDKVFDWFVAKYGSGLSQKHWLRNAAFYKRSLRLVLFLQMLEDFTHDRDVAEKDKALFLYALFSENNGTTFNERYIVEAKRYFKFEYPKTLVETVYKMATKSLSEVCDEFGLNA